MEMTKQNAYAIGRDAGNKSMRAAGRSSWSEDDWNAAAAAHQEAWAQMAGNYGLTCVCKTMTRCPIHILVTE